MPDNDKSAKLFMEDDKVFAEVFNFSVFKGLPVVRHECLSSVDPCLISSMPDSDSHRLRSRQRDLLKAFAAKSDGNAVYLLLGIENQTDVDYGMAARVLAYDAMEYERQIRMIVRNRSEPRSRPFTSGLKKGELLVPVITLVVYFGETPWDGPLCLHDMLRLANDEVRNVVPDYQLSVIDVASLTDEELRFFQTEFRNVATVLRCARSGYGLKEAMEKDASFRSLDSRTVGMINAYAGLTIPQTEEERSIDMLKGIEKMFMAERNEGRNEGEKIGLQKGREEGRQEGREEGRQEGREEGRADEQAENIAGLIQYELQRATPVNAIIDMLMKVFRISFEEATRRIKQVSAAML